MGELCLERFVLLGLKDNQDRSVGSSELLAKEKISHFAIV
ncbi:hypothetical protein M23134_01903 [Microscilla marina ATCC 23134]|uniref:Uncharacterized protein n=1 Tax=Microscilla marina ATCC 23134 TaxID=313606 RepID=A1ZC72_MICM2|nr:hypothetical protein M23134_01903 [Microscilla marina ATCC 23134]